MQGLTSLLSLITMSISSVWCYSYDSHQCGGCTGPAALFIFLFIFIFYFLGGTLPTRKSKFFVRGTQFACVSMMPRGVTLFTGIRNIGQVLRGREPVYQTKTATKRQKKGGNLHMQTRRDTRQLCRVVFHWMSVRCQLQDY